MNNSLIDRLAWLAVSCMMHHRQPERQHIRRDSVLLAASCSFLSAFTSPSQESNHLDSLQIPRDR